MNLKVATAVLSAVLSGFLLGSCVDDALYVAEGGMTGTGISAGRITGFGSVYVNGVHYNVDQASFYRDGTQATNQQAFKVGEFVTVTGTADTSNEGVASKVSFNSLLVGEVTQVSVDEQTIGIMGQTVQLNDLSVLHGVTALSAFALGNIVEVSGMRNAQGGITATSMTLVADQYPNDGTVLHVEGKVQDLLAEQQSFRLGDLTVDYSTAQLEGFLSGETLTDGRYINVETQQALQSGILIASKVSVKSPKPDFPTNAAVRVEGTVSEITSTTDSGVTFVLDNQTIVTDAQTQFKGLTLNDLAVDMVLEVKGTINTAGELQAQCVEARLVQLTPPQRFSGEITAIDSGTKTITVQSTLLVIDNGSMLLNGHDDKKHTAFTTFDALTVGSYVNVDAILTDDGTWQVLRLDMSVSQAP